MFIDLKMSTILKHLEVTLKKFKCKTKLGYVSLLVATFGTNAYFEIFIVMSALNLSEYLI